MPQLAAVVADRLLMEDFWANWCFVAACFSAFALRCLGIVASRGLKSQCGGLASNKLALLVLRDVCQLLQSGLLVNYYAFQMNLPALWTVHTEAKDVPGAYLLNLVSIPKLPHQLKKCIHFLLVF